MTKLTKSAFTIAGVLILSLAAHASPQGLGVATAYNVVTFGYFDDTSDVGGRVAVGGELQSYVLDGTNNEYLNFASASVFTDLAQGNGNFSVTENNGGNVYVSSIGTGSIQIQNGSGTILTGTNPLSFSSMQTTLTGLSTYLSSLPSIGGTVTVDSNGRYTLTANSSITVFNLTASQFSNLTAINTNGNTVTVNVSGTSITYNSGNNFTVDGVQATAGSSAASKILFNFGNAVSLNLQGSLDGVILATEATLTGNTQLNGQVFVDNLDYSGEIHGTPFNGTIPSPVPEPSTLALMGSGLVGCMWKLKRRILHS